MTDHNPDLPGGTEEYGDPVKLHRSAVRAGGNHMTSIEPDDPDDPVTAHRAARAPYGI